MAKSALLKSSLAKKYWMALTGLFLCLFLTGHLLGNLQLIFYKDGGLHFNQYALFMTTNPAVKILSYLTYISILFHAVDGFLLTYQNVKARPIGYAKNNPSANSSFSSRNMAVLGTLILIFIVTHMVNFWAVMHFDKKMPMMATEAKGGYGQKITQAIGVLGSPNMKFPVEANGRPDPQLMQQYQLTEDGPTKIVSVQSKEVIFEGYKDLYRITVAFFQDAKYGLIATILYVLSMFVLAFHLLHGFSSAFQSLGANNPKYTPIIKGFGKTFAIVVPLLFAIIPVYIHFFLK